MKRLLINIFIIAIGILIVFTAGCTNNSTSPTGPSGGSQSTNTVAMAGNAFTPSALTVALHTTVTWDNNSATAHTSTSDNGKWDTGNIPAGSSKQTTFDTAGTYHYHCTYHPNMVGTITVQ